VHLDVPGDEHAARAIAACGLDSEPVDAPARLRLVDDLDPVVRMLSIHLGRPGEHDAVPGLRERRDVEALDLDGADGIDNRAAAMATTATAMRTFRLLLPSRPRTDRCLRAER
jgi:hypothetical protein